MTHLLAPGGSIRVQNQAGITEYTRSPDGDTLTLAGGGMDPLLLPLPFLKALLEMCGYLVLERENLEAEVGHVR